MLIPSSKDKRAFTTELWARFERVTGTMAKRRGVVVIPQSIQRAITRSRPLAYRHARGDFRHTEIEMMAEQEVARWLVETWAEMHNHPTPQVQFGPHN